MCMTVADDCLLKHTQGDDEGSGKVWRRAHSDGTLQVVQHVVKRQLRSTRRQGGDDHLQVEQRASQMLTPMPYIVGDLLGTSLGIWSRALTRKGVSLLIL